MGSMAANDAFGVLGHHADAVPLPQAANEFLLEPGKLESGPFDVQHFRHVAPYHPANVHPQTLLGIDIHGGLLASRPGRELPRTGTQAGCTAASCRLRAVS